MSTFSMDYFLHPRVLEMCSEIKGQAIYSFGFGNGKRGRYKESCKLDLLKGIKGEVIFKRKVPKNKIKLIIKEEIEKTENKFHLHNVKRKKICLSKINIKRLYIIK